MSARTRATIEDLYKVEGKAELVNGEIVCISPTGWRPGRAGGKIYRRLAEYEEHTGGGYAFPVSVNSFLDTFGPKIMRHEPRHTVAHVSPGQELYIHAAQSARSHYIDAGTHAAPGAALPRYQRL